MLYNNQIYPNELPSINDIEYHGLQKEYLTALMISQSILWAVILIISFGSSFIYDEEVPGWTEYVVYGVSILIAAFSITMSYIGFKRQKYALRQRDIVYSSGVLWRSNKVVPFNRIQHAEVSQGPLDRLFNLGRLKIYTAGGSSSDLSIPGLNPDEAERIKFFILNRTVSDEEE